MMITELMRVLQFGDSVLPVGAFSFSNGLESAVQQRLVQDAQDLREFVEAATLQAATGDGIALLEAHRATLAGQPARILRADQAVLDRKLNEETRTMVTRMGKKLAEMGSYVLDKPMLAYWLEEIEAGIAPGTYPVGLGILFAELDLDERNAFAVHQYGVAMMILSAALRLMRITHLDTQAILYQVNAGAEAKYARVAQAGLDDMSAFAPMLDTLAGIHVKAHLRLFMN